MRFFSFPCLFSLLQKKHVSLEGVTRRRLSSLRACSLYCKRSTRLVGSTSQRRRRVSLAGLLKLEILTAKRFCCDFSGKPGLLLFLLRKNNNKHACAKHKIKRFALACLQGCVAGILLFKIEDFMTIPFFKIEDFNKQEGFTSKKTAVRVSLARRR